jgi:hypothetical protein
MHEHIYICRDGKGRNDRDREKNGRRDRDSRTSGAGAQKPSAPIQPEFNLLADFPNLFPKSEGDEDAAATSTSATATVTKPVPFGI